MLLLLLLQVVLCGSQLALGGASENESCNTWYYNDHRHIQCVCGISLNGGVQCSKTEQRVSLRVDYCMSQINKSEQLAGVCRYGCLARKGNRIYSLMPEDPEDLDKVLCRPYNRQGLFCGECIEGYGPSIYSFKYTFACSNCSKLSTPVATVLYLALELVPVTIFFFVIMVFRVNVTSGPVLGYIAYCQACFAVDPQHLPLRVSLLSVLPQPVRWFYYMILTLSAIWNLDFFKVSGIIPLFCISEKITDLYALWFDYVQVLYTVVLVLFTHACIELHSRNNRLIVFLWRPFHRPCIKIRRKWSDGSVTHAYATLLILMFVRLNFVFIYLNGQTLLYNVNMTHAKEPVLMINPKIRQFSQEHIPSLLFSSAMLFVFGGLPATFLCLYPTRLFRKITMRCSSRNRIAMSVFADTFQGCYKDGLNGTRDYRKTPALFMFLALALTLIYSFLDSHQLFFSILVPVFLLAFVSYAKPCKKQIMNLSLSFHVIVFFLLGLGIDLWYGNNLVIPPVLFTSGILILLATPHVLMLLWGGQKLLCFVKVYFRSNAHLSLYPL